MASPAPSVHRTLQKVCDFFYKNAFLKANAVQNVRQGQSHAVYKLLCAYLVHHETGLELPQEIVDLARDLTPEQQEGVEALGLLAKECRDIERALEEEWAALPDAAKAHLKSNTRNTRGKIQTFSKGMPLWQSIMLSAMTGGAIAWDVWSVTNIPDTSLFPRVVPFSVGTIPLTIGFLIAPGSNWRQFFDAIFQDRVFLGVSQRINLTTGIHHDEFYQDKRSYITSVGVSSVLLMLAFNLPQKIISFKENLVLGKAGNMALPEDEVAQLVEMRNSIAAKSERLDRYQKALTDLANRFVLSQGTTDALGRISSKAHKTSQLLGRGAGRRMDEKQPDFVKKSQIVALWDSILAFMFYAARENDAQIGALIPYASFAKMRMLEVLCRHTQSLQDMINLFARSGALAFVQLVSISAVLERKGSHAFDDPMLKAEITSTLSAINLTVIQYGPSVMFALGDAGKAFTRFARKKWYVMRGSRENSELEDVYFDAEERLATEHLEEEEVYFDAEEPTDPEQSEQDEVYFDALEIFLATTPVDHAEGSEPDEFVDARSSLDTILALDEEFRALGLN